MSDPREASGTARRDPLEAARSAVLAGARVGAVFPLLERDEDRDALKAWFVRAAGVPATPVRPAALLPQQTGNACGRCGGLMVRTGTCETCQQCAHSSGGCG